MTERRGRAPRSGTEDVEASRDAGSEGAEAPESAAEAGGAAEAEAEGVRPLERGLAVLRALSTATGPVRAGDLARATALARATVDRVVATLLRLGLVARQGQELSVTPRLMAFGNAYLTASGLTGEVAARTARLADHFDESVSLAVPDGDGVRFVAQATRRRTMSVRFRIGDLLPAERCAPGALFAADWDPAQWAAWRARQAADPEGTGFRALRPKRVPETDFAPRAAQARTWGWALDDQLIEPGLIAVSVPVTGADGRTRCALSAVSHTSRHTPESLAELVLPRLRAEAATLGALVATGRATEARAGARADSIAGTRAGGDTHAEGDANAEGDTHAEGDTTAADAPAPTPATRTHPAPTPATATTAPPPVSAATAPEPATTAAAAARPAPPGTALSPAALARAAKVELGPGFLQSLARGLAVLEALGAARGSGLPLAALATSTGLPRATVRRCLHTLVREGYAAHDGRYYRPLPRVLELGYARLSRLGLAEIAAPHLRELAGGVHESAALAVLDGAEIRYVARAAGARIVSPDVSPGTRFPAYPTALGRVLLGGLPATERTRLLASLTPRALTRHTVTSARHIGQLAARAAADGHACVDEELEEGLRAVAVPVHAADGAVTAALNVSLHASGGPLPAVRDALLPHLRATAAAIETDLHTASQCAPVREP